MRKIAVFMFAMFLPTCGGDIPSDEEDTTSISQSSPNTQVWIIAGQSNSVRPDIFFESGGGEVEGIVYEGSIGLQWLPLDEYSLFPAVAGYFGLYLHEYTGHEVKLIAVGLGGTSLSCWQVGNECWAIQLQDIVGIETITGIVWWQGEKEAYEGTSEEQAIYGDNFRSLIEDWRDAFEIELPFIFVELENYYPCLYDENLSCDEPSGFNIVREGQRSALTLPDVYVVETGDITNGELHPNYAYEEIGRRAAEIVSLFERE